MTCSKRRLAHSIRLVTLKSVWNNFLNLIQSYILLLVTSKSISLNLLPVHWTVWFIAIVTKKEASFCAEFKNHV